MRRENYGISRKNISRVGETAKNKFGSLMKIIEYNNNQNIVVMFCDRYQCRVKTSYDHFIKGGVRNPYDISVYGVGFIGSGEYIATVNGRETPEYMSWRNMLQRCYDPKYKIKNTAYENCSVIEEWHNYQNYAKWHNDNFYKIGNEQMELDKDIIRKGNKIYSPETCVFVSHSINTLFVKKKSARGKFPIGVTYNKKLNKFSAACGDGCGGKIKLGLTDTPEKAFNLYKQFKENQIRQQADRIKIEIPERLYIAMRNYVVEILD